MEFLLWMLPAALGPLTSWLMGRIKVWWPWVDKQQPWLQRGIVLALAFAAVKGTALLGVQLPSELWKIDGDTLNAALTALAAMGVHKLRKRQDAAP